MQITYTLKDLHLKETFAIAYGNYDTRKSLLVSLSYKGKTGYGECVEINYYGIKLSDFVLKLEELRSWLEIQPIIHPLEFYQKLENLTIHSFLRSALDCAYWDLYGKLENRSFLDLNNLSKEPKVESSYTITVAPIEDQIEKIKNHSWPKFKVKFNGFNKHGLEKLAALDFPISIDANASMSQENCIWIQQQDFSSKFMYFEQPMKVGDFEVLNRDGKANWMADEDALNENVLAQLKPHYKSVNVKLMKCGGLTPALHLLQKAKEQNFKVMLGCMTESSVGISAACALAGLLDYADLDGAALISNDYAKGSFVKNGRITLSDKPGLGISLL